MPLSSSLCTASDTALILETSPPFFPTAIISDASWASACNQYLHALTNMPSSWWLIINWQFCCVWKIAPHRVRHRRRIWSQQTVDHKVMVWWRDWYEKEVVEQWGATIDPLVSSSHDPWCAPFIRSNQLPETAVNQLPIDTFCGILVYRGMRRKVY